MLHSFDEDGNITGDAEPLAANIAGPDHKISKKALRRESVRILAALMKRSFDDLWQRERRRKTHLTISTLALALAVMSIFIASVLSLYFDDIEKEVDGAVLFSRRQAEQIIEFVNSHRQAETLLVHCYGGESRSRAVGAFAVKLLGGDNRRLLEGGNANRHVYDTLIGAWQKQM